MNAFRDDAEADAQAATNDRLAARAAANLLLARVAAVDVPGVVPGAVSRADLWTYANRAPGAPHDFRVERAVRSDADIAQRYAKLMALRTRAVSRMAAAAYEPGAAHRKLGPFSIDVVEEEGAPPALLIERLEMNHPAPTMIEAVAVEGVARVALPAEVDGHIVLDLPKDDPTRDLLRLLLANPHAAIYLI